tara:strand:+ start:1120 stop:2109 length:990 start_codon:yes stop_codon:yes gene_type:complete
MKICFIDRTDFKYSYEDKLESKLRGAETILINLSENLHKLDNEVFVFNNSSIHYSSNNYTWTDISNLKKYNYEFDVAISNGDINLLNTVNAKKKFAISYSIQTIEKFIRKKQIFTYLKNKPKIILIGKYHKIKRSFLTRIFGYDFLDVSVDDIFNKTTLLEKIDNNKAIFTSRSDRNMDLLINIWKNKIYESKDRYKLFVTPNENYNKINKYNIFLRSMKNQNDLINDIQTSRVMLVPGHKAELFCLAAEEARELCVPIVTLGIGSLVERVEHGKTGYIARNIDEFAQYTLKIFNNNKIWEELRTNLFKLRGKLSWEKSSKKFLNTLKK